jgi:DNA ligase D-like protein (predicted ligase)
MMATPSAAVPTGPEWTYEVKWDGYRTLAYITSGAVTLRSRNLKNFTATYPTVAAAVRSVQASEAILDGEIVAVDSEGRPSFQALQHRTRGVHTIVFYAFDMLHLNGRDLVRLPLETRRELLTATVGGSDVLLSTELPGTPAQIVTEVKRLGLEGIVAKRRRSLYEPGRRSRAWLKVRFAQRQEFVIGGYTPDGETFDAILVGYYNEQKQLVCAGKVRAGFTPTLRKTIHAQLVPLRTPRCSFVNLPSSKTSHWGEGITAEDMAAIVWVRPTVVTEIAFTEWTQDDNLRHAAFVALREDKRPTDVCKES